MSQISINFEENGVYCSELRDDKKTPSTKLNDVFDLGKVFHFPLNQELDGTLVPPLIPEDFCEIDDTVKMECPECEGIGDIEFSSDFGNYYTVDCLTCGGDGKIDNTNEHYKPKIIPYLVDVEYNGIKSKMRHGLAVLLFGLQGEKCRYDNNSIIFELVDCGRFKDELNMPKILFRLMK
jgi:hypothetical protein